MASGTPMHALSVLRRVGRTAALLGAVALATAAPLAQAEWAGPLGAQDARHLLVRTGFGASGADVARYAALTREAAVERLLAGTHGEPDIPPPALLRAGFTEEDLDGSWLPFAPIGCDHCKGTGYKGRVGVYEVMPISDDMRQLIMRNGNALDIRDQAHKENVRNLRQSGLLKVKSGMTSLEEIEACTND